MKTLPTSGIKPKRAAQKLAVIARATPPAASAASKVSVRVSGGCLHILFPDGRTPDRDLLLAIDKTGVTPLDARKAVAVDKAPVNLLADPHFGELSAHWQYGALDSAPSKLGLDLAPEWTLQGSHTAFVATVAAAPLGRGEVRYLDSVHGAWIPVSDTARYLFKARLGVHRCHAKLTAEFKGADGKIREVSGDPVGPSHAGGKSLDRYCDAVLEVAPRGGETAVRLSMMKTATLDGADSFLFFTRPALVPGAERGGRRGEALPVDDAFREELLALIAAKSPAKLLTCPLPQSCFDGLAHTLTVLKETGEPLAAAQTFQLPGRRAGQIDSFDGHVLSGSVPLTAAGSPARLHLNIDGVTVDTVPSLQQDRDRLAFTAAVPAEYLDARPHMFTVEGENGQPLAAGAGTTAIHLTPWNDLAAHSALPLPGIRSPRALRHLDNLDRLHRAYHAAVKAKSRKRIEDLRKRLEDAALMHAEISQPWEKRTAFAPLSFPRYASPTASVVIPCHNKWQVTYHCLLALKFAFNEATFEIILVDDGSSDETARVKDVVQGVKVVRNETALGFVHACNKGAAAARGRFIVFLNNDTEVTGGWLDELVRLVDLYPSVGLVGSKLVYPDGRLQEAGGIVWGSGNPHNYGRLQNPEDPRFSYVRQVDYLSGAAILVDRAVWKKVGGFSETYAPAYFEDTDLAFKIRAAGYRTLYAPHSIVYHYEGLTSGTSVTSGVKRFQEINRPKFKRAWANAYRSAGNEGENPDLEKDRNVAHRCLMIDYQLPRPDAEAGGYAAIQEIRLLQSLGCKVTFVPHNLAYLAGYVPLLQRMGVEVVHAPFVLSLHEVFEKRGAEFDLIYVTRYAVARAVIDYAREFSPNAKIVLNVADLHFLRELRLSPPGGDAEAVKRIESIRTDELDALRRVDLALTYSETESAVIESHTLGATKVAICPWVVDAGETVAPFASRRDVAFLGNFGHPPNAQAVRYFIDDVMPLLRKRLPGLRFVVYGNGADRLDIGGVPDVVNGGWVDDLGKVYSTCRIFVAPLVSGAGIKGKVISALSYGVPQVLSPLAAEGTGIRDRVEAFIAHSPDLWAGAIEKLYHDEKAWLAMSKAGQALAASKYSFDVGRAVMARALKLVGFQPAGKPGLTVRHSDVRELIG